MRNILRTANHRHLKYPEKFNNVKEGKKIGTGYSIWKNTKLRIIDVGTIEIPLYLEIFLLKYMCQMWIKKSYMTQESISTQCNIWLKYGILCMEYASI